MKHFFHHALPLLTIILFVACFSIVSPVFMNIESGKGGQFLFWIALMGSLGGFVFSYLENDGEIKLPGYIEESGKPAKYTPGFFGDLISGALGALVIFLIVPGSMSHETLTDFLKLSGLAAVGGFGSKSVLYHALSNALKKQTEENKEQLSKQQHTLEQQVTELQKIKTENQKAYERLNTLNFCYKSQTPTDHSDSIKKLLKIIKEDDGYLKDRELQFALSRKYKETKSYSKAIKTMTDYLERIKETTAKQNLADAYYNLVCYHTLEALTNSESDPTHAAENVRLAKEALKTSLEICSDHLPMALQEHVKAFKNDPDLNNEVGKQVLSDLPLLS